MKPPGGRRIRWTAVIGLVGLGGFGLGAVAGDESEGVCRERLASSAARGSAPAFDSLHADYERMVRSDPERGARLACAEIGAARTPREALRSRIDLGAALVQASQGETAVRILESAHGVEVPADERPLAAEIQFWLGTVRLEQREDAEAAPFFQAARTLLVDARADDSIEFARLLIGEARVFRSTGKLAEAEGRLDEADELLRRLGQVESRDAADVLSQRSGLSFERKDLSATLRFVMAELEMRRRIGGAEDRELIDPLITEGVVRTMNEDYVAAEAAYEEGRRIAALALTPSVDSTIGLLLGLATLYQDRVQFKKAMQVAEEAVALGERHYGSDGLQVFRSLLTLASISQDDDQLAKAASAYERAQAIDARHAESVGISRRLRLYLGKATVLMRLNDRSGMQEAMNRVDSLLETAPELSYYRGWRERLACKRSALEADWAAVDEHCAAAIRWLGATFPSKSRLISESIVGRCLAQARGGLPGSDCGEVRRRIDVSEIDNPLVRYMGLVSLAERAEADGDQARALALRVDALAVAQWVAEPDPLWTAQAGLATTLDAQGHRDLAIFFGKLAVESIEAMRQQFDGDAARLGRGFLSDKGIVYRRTADWLAGEGRIAEALEVTSLLKEEEQFDFNERDASALPKSDGRASMTDDEERLREDWRRLIEAHGHASPEWSRMSKLTQGGTVTKAERERHAELEAEGRATQQRLSQSIAKFLTSHRAPAAAMRFGQPEVALTKRPAPATLIIVMALAEDHVNLLLSSAAGLEARRVDVAPAELSIAVGRYLESIARRADVAQTGERLYRAIGQPIDESAARVGATHLVLVMDGALRYLPIAALSDGRRYLLEKYTIEYANIAGGGDDRSQTFGVVHPGVRAFGVTQSWRGLPALPGVVHELCSVVKGPVYGLAPSSQCSESGAGEGAVEGAAFADAQFTESRLRDFLDRPKDYSMLHIATHFSLRPGNASRSWFLTGDGRQMALDELLGIDFSGIELVTLSACQTAMGGALTDDGHEIESAAATIQRRGARAVLASLWNVDDRSTSDMMRSFYSSVHAGAAAAIALRDAQMKVLHGGNEARRHPYFWAAFQLSVDIRDAE